MSFSLLDMFPNVSNGLSNIGFFFGAGTSFKAGYPLMSDLTIHVISKLNSQEMKLLDFLVGKTLKRTIDKIKGEPNIELIFDVLESALVTTSPNDPMYLQMNQARISIREKIVDVFLNIPKPFLDDHIRFFLALNRCFSGRSTNIWIFTTNYELLFEQAAALARAPLFDGFFGSSLRYFDVQNLNIKIGWENGRTFNHYSQPTFRLVKLHGSLDWWRDCNSIYSYHIQQPYQLQNPPERVMILPRRKKITETLEPPFGELFRLSERIIGTECRYLVTCGYSYSDEHINETLLLPKVQQGKIKLTAFLKDDSPGLQIFKPYPSFSFGTEIFSQKKGGLQDLGTDLWQFERLVDTICNYSGI